MNATPLRFVADYEQRPFVVRHGTKWSAVYNATPLRFVADYEHLRYSRSIFRQAMMFLGGVFVPLASMPPALQVVACFLPLTYAVEALRAAMDGRVISATALDLAVLAAFAGVLFGAAVRTLAGRVA
ncbi:MAG: ABC transporter permease [Anaerolineae bacterium]